MEPLNPISALEFFEKELPKFLSRDKPKSKTFISELRSSLEDGPTDSYHANLLKKGRALIKHIITESIELLSSKYNSPRDRAKNFIEDFIDSFSDFEELLFGLNPNYRDHTLHSLWVYLFGHQWIHNMGGYDKIQIAGQVNMTYLEEGKPAFMLYPTPLGCDIPHLETMWAMIAILHDLGYPVQTISNEANVIFGKILEPFAIDFGSIFQIDMGSRIAVLHQNISDLVSTMYRSDGLDEKKRKKFSEKAKKIKKDKKGVPIWSYQPVITKDEELEIEYKIEWANKNHSAWSATFAFKNIPCLHESDFHGGGNIDYLKLLTRRDIIYSILHHTSQEPKDLAVNRFQFILLLMDEIEECGRFGKGGEPRGIASDYCDLYWDFSKQKLELKLDYGEYKYQAAKKFTELSQKFRAQTSRSGNYEIEMLFLDKKEAEFEERLKLSFTKDAGSGIENEPS